MQKYRTVSMGPAEDALGGKGMYINKRHACLGSDKNVTRQAGRQAAGRQADRQASRQAGRQAGRPTN